MAHREHRGPLRAGEPVIFLDEKERIYFATLKEGKKKDIRGHVFRHDDIIGEDEGLRIESNRGRSFTVMRPTLPQFLLKMPRHATIIYPKDLATILVWGDIFPGAVVLEAGLGSGALAIGLLRAVGPEGTVISYDITADAHNRGKKNVALWFDEYDNHIVKEADVYKGIEERDLDRVVLDVPEPWKVVHHAAESLRLGGVFVAFSPTTLQVHQTVGELARSKRFEDIQTSETMRRPWHIRKESVRPELQIIGHTGFLTFARRVQMEVKRPVWDEAG